MFEKLICEMSKVRVKLHFTWENVKEEGNHVLKPESANLVSVLKEQLTQNENPLNSASYRGLEA